jgi:hypothetical protein
MRHSSAKPRAAALAVVAIAALGACSMPRIPFISGYHEVTVADSVKTYCTDRLRRDGAVVEFEDGATGAWMSAASATTREITAAEYRSCIGR